MSLSPKAVGKAVRSSEAALAEVQKVRRPPLMEVVEGLARSLTGVSLA